MGEMPSRHLTNYAVRAYARLMVQSPRIECANDYLHCEQIVLLD